MALRNGIKIYVGGYADINFTYELGKTNRLRRQIIWLGWLINIMSIVLLLALAVIVFFIVRSKIKAKKSGNGCGCGCSGCSGCSACAGKKGKNTD